MKDLRILDPAEAVQDPEAGLAWYDIAPLTVEAQAWGDTKHRYDRLTRRAEGVVRDPLWEGGQCSTGLFVRFSSDTRCIAARWTLRNEGGPGAGSSGLDLYAEHEGQWKWAGVGAPAPNGLEHFAVIVKDMPVQMRKYMLYLPLGAQVDRIKIGIPPENSLYHGPVGGSFVERKPLCFYGTSVMNGGCASRPGSLYTAIMSRRLGRVIYNFGFGGNGKCDPELSPFLAELDVEAFVMDMLPNMEAPLILERMEPFARTLREANPDTPIILVESLVYQNELFHHGFRDRRESSNAALRKVFKNLTANGDENIHLMPGDDMLGHDGEAGTDSTHPSDLGFRRMADAQEAFLRGALTL